MDRRLENMVGYADEDEEEYLSDEEEQEVVESDLLVVAKFAQLGVQSINESLPLPTVFDPAEIDLSETTRMEKQAEDAEESSSSSSSSDDEDDDGKPRDGDDNDGDIASGDEDDDVDPDPSKSNGGLLGGPMTKNEIPYGMAPLEPLPDQTQLLPGDKIVQALKVTAVQSNMLVASSLGSPVLDSGSVVCTTDRMLIGRVDDVFGPVVSPFYTVRLMAPEPRPTVSVGDVLCWVEKFSVIVNCAALDTRGTDASNLVDEEAADEAEEDDDEQGGDMDSLEEEDQSGPYGVQPNTTTRPATSQSRSRGRGKNASRGGRSRPESVKGTSRSSAGVRRRPQHPALSPVRPSRDVPFPSHSSTAGPYSSNVQMNTSTLSHSTSISQTAMLQPPTAQLPQGTMAFPPQQQQAMNLPPGWPVPKLPAGWPAFRF